MNSMSKSHCCEEREPWEKEKKEKKVCPTLIKCGTPSSTTASTTTTTPFPVASLTLNTSCLCDPCIKLEFASNLIASATLVGTVNFQVFKLCRGQFTAVPIGSVWTFGSTVALGSIVSQTFSFFVCDCDSCFDDCCTYTVVATASITAGTLNVNNALLGAIVTCGDNECHSCK